MISWLRYRIRPAWWRLTTNIGAAIGIPLVFVGSALSYPRINEPLGDTLIWIALIVLIIAYGAYHIRTVESFKGELFRMELLSEVFKIVVCAMFAIGAGLATIAPFLPQPRRSH